MENDSDKYPPLSDEEYRKWRALIQERMGLSIRESRTDFLKRRLWERMRHLSLNSYDTYHKIILDKDPNHREWQNLLELLVNCQSSFFRHLPSFDALMNTVLPEMAKLRASGQMEMWSVGCSRGQEAYSLSMAFHHVLGADQGSQRFKLNITATDISFSALERAKKAEYSFLEVRDMPDIFREKYMTETDRSDDRESKSTLINKHLIKYRVKHEIRKPVNFRFFNLNLPDSLEVGQQDIIFCQNVFIYFSVDDRAKSIHILLKHLKPGGYLFLGPGEAVGIKISGAVQMHFKDTLCYRRTDEEVHVRITQR